MTTDLLLLLDLFCVTFEPEVSLSEDCELASGESDGKNGGTGDGGGPGEIGTPELDGSGAGELGNPPTGDGADASA